MAIYEINNRQEPIKFECEKDSTARILQNCKNLILCRMGEIPYDRMRGINPAIYDLPVPEANDVLMPEIDRVFGWEKRASPLSATMSREESGEWVITVYVEVQM